MCGIVGFIGSEQAAPILLEGLARLEYRGYDSAGLAVLDPQEGLRVEKAKGSRLGHPGSHALLCVFSRKSNTLPVNNIHDWTCDHRHG